MDCSSQIENEQTIQDFAPSDNNGHQYNNLSFGGTLNNGDTQGNLAFVHQPVTEMLNSRMDINYNQNHFEGEDRISDTNNNNHNASESYANTQSLTTENTCADGPYINMYDYSCQLLEKLNLIVTELRPTLVNINGPSEDADCLLRNLQISLSQHSNLVFQKPLQTLADVLQLASDIVHGSSRKNSADLPAEESDGTSEQRVSPPQEENNDQLNEQFQAPIESNLPTTSNDNCLTTLSMALSQLMLQVRNVVEEFQVVELYITEQPKEFWTKRSINCLKQKWCPAIQGRSGIQRHYTHITWSELIDCHPDGLFILVQLLSFNNQAHPSNILVPPGTIVQQRESFERKKKNDHRRPTLDDLVIKDNHGLDKKSKAILCPVTKKEYKERKKNLNVMMFRLYKTSEEINHSDDDEDEEDISVEEKLLKLCKMRLCLCRQRRTGELVYASNFVDTEWIEESKGNQPLAVDASKVIPQYLCTCGNETITVPLNTDSEKHGFDVRLNDQSLKFHEIRGVKNKQISFNSAPKTAAEQDYLNIKVSKESISKTIQENHDPYNGLDEIRLLDIDLPYVEHSNNPHAHIETSNQTRSFIQ